MKKILNNKFIINKRKSLKNSYNKSIYSSTFIKKDLKIKPKKVKLEIVKPDYNYIQEPVNNKKSIDSLYILNEDISYELEELEDELTAIIRKLKNDLVSIAFNFKEDVNPKDYKTFFKNINYLEELPICSIIIIDNLKYFKLAEWEESGQFLNMETGQLVHFSRICPYHYVLQDPIEITEEKKDRLIKRIFKKLRRK
jgi:hypothetical protein